MTAATFTVLASDLRVGQTIPGGVRVEDVEPTTAVCSTRRGAAPEPAVRITYTGGARVTLAVGVKCSVTAPDTDTCPACGSDDVAVFAASEEREDEADLAECNDCHWTAALTPDGAASMASVPAR